MFTTKPCAPTELLLLLYDEDNRNNAIFTYPHSLFSRWTRRPGETQRKSNDNLAALFLARRLFLCSWENCKSHFGVELPRKQVQQSNDFIS